MGSVLERVSMNYDMIYTYLLTADPSGCEVWGVGVLRLWVRIPPGAWMFVCCECCVLSGRGLCDELITRPEESYRPWSVVVRDLETSWMRRGPGPLRAVAPKTNQTKYLLSAIGLPPGGSSTVIHLHTNNAQNNTMKQNTQNRTYSYIAVRIHKHNNTNT